ncbi:LOW QUALITY PROTEIN: BTB/POZ domain-containing adapter for CUL3-mediated RhoA degradation protein 2-like [Marmota monax]|uniref:LOW QUALITY PROTEIN: BTB/POZ domain-containing adapter for CUL3-mediated RhoA degradation protein 2-like n=1 Tax=Marmota monax TaxID=9995 RepID=UPI001EB04C54|nr:LOW QUALITY PROTEIN: BTB/POZ domain-containing adapter for CUL3-mediated RhoA degradation protein 2-like [Marmota monax]
MSGCTGRSLLEQDVSSQPRIAVGQAATEHSLVNTSTTAEPSKPTSCCVVIYLQREIGGGGDTCLCPASGAKPKLSGFKGGGLDNKYVQLNVVGSLYYTTVRVLTQRDTMLKAMFSGRMEVLTDKEGWIPINRCGKHFGTILNYLRDDPITLPQNRQEIKELMAEEKYYLIQGLVNMCQTALQDKKDSYQPVSNIPIITSLREEDRLIKSSTKPMVKLLYNRSNNKYSYTSNSEDHLLKNIQLFDKLSLRFSGRVLFIKDVIGDEICCWSFYGQGRKLAEVCCTHSIVYATEKKQTKVEFPEARIYEETLNVLLLYETPQVPDNSLLEATSRSRSQASPSEDEEAHELRDHVRRIHVKRYSTYDDRQLDRQSAHRD